ncbi:Uncharacterised protein (plasmid) [Tsukamurella tyrosinosolvens]|uniref:Uncharacterized protein n=1 Tax=Tsukamurella tyrosinosolvens TaxID=57704 RepID=A0A1H4V316_TSUTY|nr:hypothetical protein [Tsukamurella tyrosinosolvens]KXO91070.1 hypothetical protein AXK58_21810 [Tsukamurella tyrosinosolvens]SEC75190.1 hypothetical protein SAMN04489793_3119 [Tsukamurella tyrosinosolvens]VEH90726.1 Uncharacterised protein [Tsukamurella tyrosinosolvens]
MSRISAVEPADLCEGDLIDLVPLLDCATGPLSVTDRAAATSGYATILSTSRHGDMIFIRTDILDLRVRNTDRVDLLVDDPD